MSAFQKIIWPQRNKEKGNHLKLNLALLLLLSFIPKWQRRPERHCRCATFAMCFPQWPSWPGAREGGRRRRKRNGKIKKKKITNRNEASREKTREETCHALFSRFWLNVLVSFAKFIRADTFLEWQFFYSCTFLIQYSMSSLCIILLVLFNILSTNLKKKNLVPFVFYFPDDILTINGGGKKTGFLKLDTRCVLIFSLCSRLFNSWQSTTIFLFK